MWQKLTDCGKQLNAGYKVRQLINDDGKYDIEYNINSIDIDNYELHIVSKEKNDIPVETDQQETLLLTCAYLMDNNFEVWVEE